MGGTSYNCDTKFSIFMRNTSILNHTVSSSDDPFVIKGFTWANCLKGVYNHHCVGAIGLPENNDAGIDCKQLKGKLMCPLGTVNNVVWCQ